MAFRERVHPSGRLAFRSSVREPRATDLPCHEAGEAPVDWAALQPEEPPATMELEIGCGKGTFLVEAARRRPEVHFIGVEAGRDYARYCADRVVRGGLANAVLVADDARLFLKDTVPPRTFARIHVYHPDPWPKRRHRKRRLIGDEFVALAHRSLVPGGELLVATDNTRYFGEILAVLGKSPRFLRSVEREEQYGDETPGLAFGPTNFSRKYIEEGRARHRAVYVMVAEGREPPSMTENGAEGWIRVATVEEIPEDEGLAVTVDGQELALFRNGDRIACLEESCPHRGAALSEGKVREGEVVCPWHGWRFRLRDGACNTLPGSMPARTFEVRLDGKEVWVKVSRESQQG